MRRHGAFCGRPLPGQDGSADPRRPLLEPQLESVDSARARRPSGELAWPWSVEPGQWRLGLALRSPPALLGGSSWWLRWGLGGVARAPGLLGGAGGGGSGPRKPVVVRSGASVVRSMSSASCRIGTRRVGQRFPVGTTGAGPGAVAPTVRGGVPVGVRLCNFCGGTCCGNRTWRCVMQGLCDGGFRFAFPLASRIRLQVSRTPPRARDS